MLSHTLAIRRRLRLYFVALCSSVFGLFHLMTLNICFVKFEPVCSWLMTFYC